MPVSPATLARDLEEPERTRARERSLRLLTQREHSRAELAVRLRDDGYPPSAVEDTLQALVRSGLVDDVRFADAWAHSRARQGYGRRRIATELAQRGVSEDVASAALDAACSDDEVRRARALLRGAVPHDRKQRDRALRRLLARGFEFPVALQALDSSPSDEPDVEYDPTHEGEAPGST
jgi:regulatory protein